MDMTHWRPMEEYPDKGHRDESGKWTDVPGPLVELQFANGDVVEAKWYGAKTRGGGEAWAFWQEGSTVPIGFYEPQAWRQVSIIPFQLRRRRESVTATEILEWIKQQPDGSGWLATVRGVELALDEICQ